MGQSFYDLLKDAAFAGGGGGSPAPVLIEKSVTENGTYTAADDEADGYSAVTVNVSGGSSTAAQNDVNFYDYDGTVANSYSAAEFAQLSEMPDNPSHTGLTAQGWNWALSDAKAYVEKYGKLNIGQMYITSDGKTRLYITLSEGRTTPWLKLYLNVNSELDIDWGDGSTHSTFTSTSAGYKNEQHVYASAGDHVIAITVVNGSFSLQSSSTSLSTLLTNNNGAPNSPDMVYLNSIKRIEIGRGVTAIGASAFQYCCSLSSVTIPDSVTSIASSAFQYCYSLSSATMPDSVTSIASSAFQSCYSLSSVTIPDSVTSIASSAFNGCFVLSSVTIPDSVTSIGNNTFTSCSIMSSITMPDSVTSIGAYAFTSCSIMSSITIPDSVTRIGDYAFSSCYSLSSVTIPDSVTSIGNGAFNDCRSLTSITINKPEGSISGSPWGATKGSPTYTQIVWTG